MWASEWGILWSPEKRWASVWAAWWGCHHRRLSSWRIRSSLPGRKQRKYRLTVKLGLKLRSEGRKPTDDKKRGKRTLLGKEAREEKIRRIKSEGRIHSDDETLVERTFRGLRRASALRVRNACARTVPLNLRI